MNLTVEFEFSPGDAVRITRFDKIRSRDSPLTLAIIEHCLVERAGVKYYAVHRLFAAERERECYPECELELAPETEKEADADAPQTE